ncbi:MAG: dephospho-CoA kinase [Ruminococcus sp.]|nr:dephospho-CoA kinase [Ruminococcus sp.]
MNSLDGGHLVVGLTGQTGAGKSTVSKTFAENGFVVINADHISRLVVQKGTECLEELQDVFGSEIITAEGTLNRKALASIVFSDKKKLEILNLIIYPYITEEILHRIDMYSANGEKLILLDAPTLFESRADDFCDLIISVVSDEEIRERRIIERDGLTEDEARKRMSCQLDEEFFKKYSDFIINNNESLERVNEISKEVSDKIKDYYYNKINHITTLSE